VVPQETTPRPVRIEPFGIDPPGKRFVPPLRVRERVVALDGAANGRDLGLLHTTDGRRVRPGLMFRCSDLSRLTDRDLATLEARELGRVFDLRGPPEVAGAPDRMPGGARWIPLAIHGGEDADDALLERALRTNDVGTFERLLGGGGAQRMMLDAYRSIATEAAPVFARFFAELLENEGPALFHCAAGKDRTGICAALFLRILGVPDDVILGDFLLSNVFRAAEIDGVISTLGATFERAELLRPVLEVRPELLKAAFDAIDDAHGDFPGYVRDALHLDGDAVARLRERYLEPIPEDRTTTRIGRAALTETGRPVPRSPPTRRTPVRPRRG
jgi:protein-tyrosine phosphatase